MRLESTGFWYKFFEFMDNILNYFSSIINFKLIRILKDLSLTFKAKVIFVIQKDTWAVYWVSKNISDNLTKQNLINAKIGIPRFLNNKIIHWGAINLFLKNSQFNNLKKFGRNYHFATLFHLIDNDKRIKFIPLLNKKLDLIVTPSPFTKKTLIEYGFTEEKIALIPLGVNLSHFKAYDEEKKKELKLKYNLPTDKIIIGSFQKDGAGWGDGMEPKLVKGPDIFCEVVRKLNDRFDIHVFLTGPARGYVKNRLEESQISYTHLIIPYLEIVNCYNVLDLYIIASRIEGGPLALPEGMATGVPIITTNVGMASYYIKNGVNGFITEVEDVESLYECCVKVLENNDLKEKIILNAFETVKNYSWENIAKEYYYKGYRKFIQ